VSSALSGDVVARIQAAPDRLDELDEIVRGRDGRIEDRAT
jgi:hypothetical protein